MLLERAGDIGGTWRDNTYPGCRCDVPVAPLLVLVRAEPELVEHLLAAAGDPRLPARRAPTASACCRTCASTPSWSRPTGTTTSGCWRIETSQGAITADVLIAAQGPLSRAAALPDAARARELRGHDLPLGPLGPRPRPRRRARGRDRHRRLRDPVRARDPAAGRASCTSSSAPPPWVMPAPQPADDAAASGRSTRLFPPAQLAMRAGIYWARETFVLQFRHRAMRQAAASACRCRHLSSQVQGPRAAREAHAELQHRLQAHPARPNEWYPALVQPNVEVVTDGDHRDPAALDRGRRRRASARSTRSSSAPAST